MINPWARVEAKRLQYPNVVPKQRTIHVLYVVDPYTSKTHYTVNSNIGK
jgi:hypothetical protein